MKLSIAAIFLFLIMIPHLSIAQQREIKERSEIERITQEIASELGSATTIRCDFTQQKSISMLQESIITKGDIFYDLQRDSICIVTESGTNVITAATNPVFSEISKLIESSKEQKKIVDEINFKASYFIDGDFLKIIMTPKKSRLKRIFGNISLSFNLASKDVRSIEIIDANQDITTIELQSINIQ